VSEKAIEKKKDQVAQLAEKMKEANSVVVVDYLGLTVAEASELRRELMKNGCEFKVVKNNIIRRAAEAEGHKEILEHIEGPNALAFSFEDSVAAAKVIYDFAKDHKKLELKVGIVDGEFMDNENIKMIATIPSREELLTMFAGGILEPVKHLAMGLNMHIENQEENREESQNDQTE